MLCLSPDLYWFSFASFFDVWFSFASFFDVWFSFAAFSDVCNYRFVCLVFWCMNFLWHIQTKTLQHKHNLTIASFIRSFAFAAFCCFIWYLFPICDADTCFVTWPFLNVSPLFNYACFVTSLIISAYCFTPMHHLRFLPFASLHSIFLLLSINMRCLKHYTNFSLF